MSYSNELEELMALRQKKCRNLSTDAMYCIPFLFEQKGLKFDMEMQGIQNSKEIHKKNLVWLIVIYHGMVVNKYKFNTQRD